MSALRIRPRIRPRSGLRRRTPPRFRSSLSIGVALALPLITGCSGVAGSGDATAGDLGAREAEASASDRAGDADGATLQVPGSTVPVRPEVRIPDGWDSDVEEVYGRYWLYWEAFAAAHAPPNADPSFEPLRELSTPDNWRSLQADIRSFAEDGLVLVLPENSITEHLIRIPNASVLAKDEGADVVLQDCWIDDFVQQTVDGRVVAETKEARLMNVTMKVTDGEWRVDGVARATPESDGYEQCVALVSR
ncbi:MAG: hypothetical protein WBM50_05975 [Acidimicrobiales bacterium]